MFGQPAPIQHRLASLGAAQGVPQGAPLPPPGARPVGFGQGVGQASVQPQPPVGLPPQHAFRPGSRAFDRESAPPQFFPQAGPHYDQSNLAPSAYADMMKEGVPEFGAPKPRPPYDPSNSFRPWQEQKARLKKFQQSVPGRFEDLPVNFPIATEASNTESNSNNATQVEGEAPAQVRRRAAGKKKTAKQKGERYGHAVPRRDAKVGSMQDPNGPWRYFPQQGQLPQAAMQNVVNTRDPAIYRLKRREHKKKFAHPTGREDWFYTTESGWGGEQTRLHVHAVSQLKRTLAKPDIAILSALRYDMIHSTRGITNNVAMGEILPKHALSLSKSVVKHKGCVTKLHMDLADDAARLHGFEDFCAQLTTAKEGQHWIHAQLNSARPSKSGKHVRVGKNLQTIEEFYIANEGSAELNIRALKETKIEGVGYDRIDRFMHNLALDLHRAVRAYDQICDQVGYPGYEEMMEAISQATSDEDGEGGVWLPGLDDKIYRLASLIIATHQLHFTDAGNAFIKEKMFDILGNFKLILTELCYKNEQNYESLQYIDFRSCYRMLNDLTHTSVSYRRTVYEANLIFSAGSAAPIEMLKMAHRTFKASTRGLANVVRAIRGNRVSLRTLWEAPAAIFRRALDPMFAALTSIRTDYFEDSPEDEALVHDPEAHVNSVKMTEVLSTLRRTLHQQYSEDEDKQHAVGAVCDGIEEGIQECAEAEDEINDANDAVNDEEVIDEDGSIAAAIKHFQDSVQEKLKKKNREHLKASARRELEEASQDMAVLCENDEDGSIDLVAEKRMSPEAIEQVQQLSQDSEHDLPLSDASLDDREQLRRVAEEEISVQIRDIRATLEAINEGGGNNEGGNTELEYSEEGNE